ncbi:copia-like retrotransposon, partial [Tanacetum coccineum]
LSVNIYVLDPLLAPIPANPVATEGQEVDPNEVLELEKQRMIRKEDETLCCGHIKKSLSDMLYDVYAPITDPRKLWSALEFKYKQQEEDDYSLDDLLKHLRIEEEARNRDKRVTHGSTVHHVQVGNSSKRGSRNGPTKFNLSVNRDKFKKTGPSKRTGKCHVCGDTGHYARECKLRKSGNDDVNMVNGEIADRVAHVHLDDDNFVA